MTGFLNFGSAGSAAFQKRPDPELVDKMIERLRVIMPKAREADVADFAPAILTAMETYDIRTPERQAMFLAQIAHESDQLWKLRDSPKIMTPRGEEYASGQAYEGREDLGNTEDGDGPRYKGRGLLQITGRANYKTASDRLGVDLVANPDALNDPGISAAAAGEYWQSHGLNEYADAGDFQTITRRINGGLNGLAQRQAFLAVAEGTYEGPPLAHAPTSDDEAGV